MIQTYLAFDFGLYKIGVAIGQSLTQIASPLCIVKAKEGEPDWEAIQKLIQTWHPTRCIVGLPFHIDQSESEMSQKARLFGARLTEKFNVLVEFIDERLSSFEVKLHNKENKKKPTKRIDADAAAVILQTWFNQL